LKIETVTALTMSRKYKNIHKTETLQTFGMVRLILISVGWASLVSIASSASKASSSMCETTADASAVSEPECDSPFACHVNAPSTMQISLFCVSTIYSTNELHKIIQNY